MARLTDRDKRCYQFLIDTGLPMTSHQVARCFYNQSGNLSSAVVIANRRLKVLYENNYLERLSRKFGESQIFYAREKPNQKQLRHKLLMSEFIASLSSNGFEILSVETEKQFMDGELRSDLFIKAKYHKDEFYIIAEVDLSKDFNVGGYEKFISKLQSREIKFDKKLLIVSISDRKIESDIKKYIITLDTELKNIEKIKWQFIK